MRQIDLINEAMEKTNCRSRRELARRLGVTSQSMIKWEKGTATPKDTHILMLAEMTGRDPKELLHLACMWRAENNGEPEAADFWRKLLSTAAAVIMFLSISGITPYSQAHSLPSGLPILEMVQPVLYIMV